MSCAFPRRRSSAQSPPDAIRSSDLITPETQRAIDRGLAWLSKRQVMSGRNEGAFGHGGYPGGVAVGSLAGSALVAANVDSVTLFAKCHHGMSYYPTKVGKVHPGLMFDLLGAQIEACHKRDIRAPIFVFDSERHRRFRGLCFSTVR